MDDQDLKPLGDGWHAVVAYALARHGYKFVSWTDHYVPIAFVPHASRRRD